jgi:hypothetical protein
MGTLLRGRSKEVDEADHSVRLHVSQFSALLEPDPEKAMPQPSAKRAPGISSDRHAGKSYPLTNGRPGGKLPMGKQAFRSPAFSLSAAS